MVADVGINGRYDCAFKDASGNLIGLMLTRDKNGIPSYSEYNDPGVSNQLYTGMVNYSALKPQMELQLGQSDWRSGFGLEYWDSSQPKRYYTSNNVDARFKGMAICSPLITTITPPYALHLSNPGFEWYTGSVPADWSFVQVSGSSTLEAATGADVDTGNYAAKIRGSNSFQSTLSQIVTTWNSVYRGLTVTIKWKAKISGSGTPSYSVTIDDGVDTTTSSTYSDASYTLRSITHTINAAATKLEVTVTVANGTSSSSTIFCIDSFQTDIPFCYYCHKFVEFNDNLYLAAGNTLFKLNSTGDEFELVESFLTEAGEDPHRTITDIESFIDDKLYIALGTGGYYYYMDDAESFTQSDSYAYHLKRIGNVMYKSLLPSEIYTATDPTADANWSTATNIGSSADNITSIQELEGTPIIMKEDYPYYLDDSGDVFDLGSFMSVYKTSTSGRVSLVWNGKLYVACGTRYLYEYDNGTWTDISPVNYITNWDVLAATEGKVVAMAADSQWLYAFVYISPSSAALLAGRWENIDGETSWVWHMLNGSLSYNHLAGVVGSAFVSSVYKPRLWASTVTNIKHLDLTVYGNVTTGTFQTGGNIITPWMHADLQGDYKAYTKLTLTTQSCTSNVYWTAKYQKLGDTEWTTIGNYNTSPVQSAYIPVDSSGVKPYSTMMRFQFLPVTNSTSTTPVLLNWDCRAIWYPAHKTIIDLQVVVSDNPKLNRGMSEENQSASAIRTAINAWKNPAVSWPRAFYPPYYQSDSDIIYCKIIPTESKPFCQMVKNDVTGELEWVYNLTLLVVDGVS